MKKILSGIIIGVLICSVIPIKAAIDEYILYKADYSIVINGENFNDEDHPILNYKGTTYAPVRSVLEASGLQLTWNAAANTAYIYTPPEQGTKLMEEETPTSTPTPEPTSTETNTGGTTPTPTPTPQADNSAAYQAEYDALTSAYNSTVQGYRDELKWYYDEYKKWADAYGSTDAVQQKLNIYKEKESHYNGLIAQATSKYSSDVAILKTKYGM